MLWPGGKLLTTFSDHHKTVTSLGFCNNYERITSVSLDRHLKIYDVGTYQVVHTLDYPSSILSAAIAPDNKVVVVGMADGLLSIRHRKDTTGGATKKSRTSKKSSYRYTLESHRYKPKKDDHVVVHNQRPLLAKYDKYLKAFRYTQTLDAALSFRVRIHTPHVTVSVIVELIRRDGLRGALAGRDEKSLTSIIKFLQK
ncbi:hypothetical protein NP493_261g01017 [Ridgeia piscesae]|uniref:U3 small nucleolar RNA-associated protein 15 homolog n=1 Tax=Ridgeia piscesae TaxID=27915 RepID=A0AAD9UCL9_RIDPI|nr:hypothetical protein NP493_261g01017 [Ridgeia piscesae]